MIPMLMSGKVCGCKAGVSVTCSSSGGRPGLHRADLRQEGLVLGPCCGHHVALVMLLGQLHSPAAHAARPRMHQHPLARLGLTLLQSLQDSVLGVRV